MQSLQSRRARPYTITNNQENKLMKKYIIIFITILAFSITASACSGSRLSASGWPGLTTDQDNAYLAAGQHVYAVNLKNGTLRWKYPAEAQNNVTFFGAPALTDDGQLIITGYDSNVYSLNPANGEENWRYERAQDRFIAGALVTPKGIFAASADHNLYAISLEGGELWSPFETDEPIWAPPSTTEAYECIYLASMDHHIYAINIEDGALLWKTEDLGGPIVSKPIIADGTIFASTFANEVLAIDAEDHDVLWRFETQDWAWASPIPDGDQVYASDLSGTFYALDQETGDLAWQIQPGGRIVSASLVTGDKIYFGTDEGSLIVADKNGTIQRNQTVEGELYTSPAANEDLILVAPTGNENLLIAYDENGVKRWDFAPSD